MGVTKFCKRPHEAATKEKIGTPLRPDIEKIISMKPDLILGSREGNPPWVMKKLKRTGITVHYFERPKTFQDLLHNFLHISMLLGKEEEGKKITEGVKNALSTIHRGVKLKVLWQVGADPLVVASTTSFANDIIGFAGGINIVATEIPYPRMNMEEVIVKKPDLIVLMDMGYNVEMEMNQWQKHLQHARFAIMDAYVVGSPTPVSFLEAVTKLSRAMTNK